MPRMTGQSKFLVAPLYRQQGPRLFTSKDVRMNGCFYFFSFFFLESCPVED
jgi:hypothetical protein